MEGKGVWSEFGILKLGMLEDCKAVLVYEHILDEAVDMLLSEVDRGKRHEWNR